MDERLARETQRMRSSVLGAVVSIAMVVGLYLEGLSQVALVATVAFMLGYIVERRRLHRTIAELLATRSAA